ncbi:unnamed protein product [Caretta caretta]
MWDGPGERGLRLAWSRGGPPCPSPGTSRPGEWEQQAARGTLRFSSPQRQAAAGRTAAEKAVVKTWLPMAIIQKE